MTRLWYLPTSWLLAAQRWLARRSGLIGLRDDVANELWVREELEHRTAEAREYWQ